jgi:hypothetical protein
LVASSPHRTQGGKLLSAAVYCCLVVSTAVYPKYLEVLSTACSLLPSTVFVHYLLSFVTCLLIPSHFCCLLFAVYHTHTRARTHRYRSWNGEMSLTSQAAPIFYYNSLLASGNSPSRAPVVKVVSGCKRVQYASAYVSLLSFPSLPPSSPLSLSTHTPSSVPLGPSPCHLHKIGSKLYFYCLIGNALANRPYNKCD